MNCANGNKVKAMKSSTKLLLCVLVFILGMPFGYSQKTKTVLIDDDIASLTMWVKDGASLADADWLYFELRNQSSEQLSLEKLDMSINTFEENESGEQELRKGAWGTAKKYELIHWFHDQHNMVQADRKFKLRPQSSISFWKAPSSRAALAIETSIVASEEVCALIEFQLNYKINGILKELSHEDFFCTQWTKMTQVDRDALTKRFVDAIEDVHIQEQQVNYLSLLTDLHPVLLPLPDSLIVDGIIQRKHIKNSKERLLLLRGLEIKESIEQDRLRDHYLNCMTDPNCQWEDDLQFYWHNDLFQALKESALYINQKAMLLELHAKHWKNDPAFRNDVFNYLQSEYKIDFSEEITENNFEEWHNKIKYLAISRHDTLVPYLKNLLSDQRFFPIEDWSQIGSKKIIKEEDRSKMKTLHFRVCDVAYVALLRCLNQITVYNDFVRKKVKPSVHINSKWEGHNPDTEQAIQLKTPYTVLQPNLRMAEKYYYYFGDNRAPLNSLLKKYEDQ